MKLFTLLLLFLSDNIGHMHVTSLVSQGVIAEGGSDLWKRRVAVLGVLGGTAILLIYSDAFERANWER